MQLTSFEDLEAVLRERTNFELRTPPASGFHLERMAALVAALGHPERAYPIAHVAGTCGKGTTSAGLASCLDAAGLRVGWTTSPHLVHLRERIRVGARPASEELWLNSARAVFDAADTCPDPATYFELIIAMAFEAFRRAEVEVAVVEVGLGGRLDATNVLAPAVSVITRIGLDHTDLLGSDLASIAREKAGIIEPTVPVVAGPESEQALAVVRARADALDAPLLLLDRDLGVDVLEDDGLRCSARLTTPWGPFEVEAPLSGAVTRNLPLIAGALGSLLPPDPAGAAAKSSASLGAALRAGLARLRWRGRFDVVAADLDPEGGPQDVVIDGAHDAASVGALVERYRSRYGDQRCVLLFGALRDKPVEAVLGLLAPLCLEAMCCSLRSPRSADPQDLVRALERSGVRAQTSTTPLTAAANRARVLGAPLLVTGSLYLAGHVLAELDQDPGPGWSES